MTVLEGKKVFPCWEIACLRIGGWVTLGTLGRYGIMIS